MGHKQGWCLIKFIMNKSYLITGGEGFIGSVITSKVQGSSYDIKSGLDVLNFEELSLAISNSKGVFHCAAKISVPESIQKPKEYYTNNVIGTEQVVNAAKTYSIKVVFSSSAAVYGESSKALQENSSTNPKSPYAENKLDGENQLLRSGQPHIALRYFNVYGPGQSAQYAGVITTFITRALNKEDLIIYGDGNQTRDFIFIDDIVDANIAAMNYRGKNFEIFNIGSGEKISIMELASNIIRLTGSTSRIKFCSSRSGDIHHSVADISKAREILQWKPKISFEEGLIKTISYYKGV